MAIQLNVDPKVPDPQGYADRVQYVLKKSFTAQEFEQLVHDNVHISVVPRRIKVDKGKIEEEKKKYKHRYSAGGAAPRKKFLRLSTAAWDSASPLRNYLLNDFEFVAAHEIQHMLLEGTYFDGNVQRHTKSKKDAFKNFQARCMEAAGKAVARANEIAPAEIAEMEEWFRKCGELADPHQSYTLPLHYSFRIEELPENKQIALCVDSIFSPDGYKISGWYQPDDYAKEMACELRGLIHKFGKEKVRPLAGKFIDYMEMQSKLYCERSEQSAVMRY